MILYGELVQYIKDYHVNWNTDLFEVLKGFFEARDKKDSLPSPPSSSPSTPPHQPSLFTEEAFRHPDSGEYSTQDLYNLLST